MKEEFAAYGLPAWVVPVTRVVKISLAVGLLFGYFFPVGGQASRVCLNGHYVRCGHDALKASPRPINQSLTGLLASFIQYFSYPRLG